MSAAYLVATMVALKVDRWAVLTVDAMAEMLVAVKVVKTVATRDAPMVDWLAVLLDNLRADLRVDC